ncbi:dihydroorotase [Thermosipho ferrireducens]|uniref:Dihydroorotase n=1 Tax=Thermosipho ferrireducens TaxID=2571116 RepID=A0ABX7S7X2_9BACT|nr:dihydroorotase [Thermosipho ferrireducens]QTA38309.1 dihydroorotase [Thermosipho ferrireducens]
MKMLIKNSKVISHSTNGYFNILIEDHLIRKITTNIPEADIVIDASNLITIPGIIDMHAHLREPGYEYKETLKTGLMAAVHGGVTTLGIMPNTNPSIDNLKIANNIKTRAQAYNLARPIIIPSLTKNRAGKELNNIKLLIKNGYKFFSDDGNPIYDAKIMFESLTILKKFNGIIINHCEDTRFKNTDLFESLMVARDVELSKYTGARVHIAHISTSNTIDLIKYAKSENINITCEVTFHHLLLTNREKDPLKKINPPLPDIQTQKKLIENLEHIDIIVSDHAPHSFEEKNLEYENAPNGISGLDVFFPALCSISKKYNIDLEKLIEKVTYQPAKIFNLNNIGDIKEGYYADIVLVDTNKTWDGKIFSKGKNLPYKQLHGKVILTIVNGEIKYDGRK